MKRIIAALLGLVALGVTAGSGAKETKKSDAWPFRYAIFVDTESWYQAAVNNWKKNPREYSIQEGFIPASYIKAKGAKERLAAMRVDFDQQGNVTTKTLNGVPLQGVLDSDFLHLITPKEYQPAWDISTFMEWLAYSPDIVAEGLEWEEGRMTFCDHRGTERLQAEMINEVDGPTIKFKLEPEEGIFYCNDWSRQLANPRRPWIDVTSYEKRGPRVRKFQGYGLFGVTKPVVGKHYKTWICFADCPDGKPGPIADIKAWSKQYGLPVEDKEFGMVQKWEMTMPN